MKSLLFLLCFSLACQASLAQIVICDFEFQPDVAVNKNTSQSSNYSSDGGFSSLAADGFVGTTAGTYSHTKSEYRAWWEVDLGENFFVRGIKIYYPANVYPTGFERYYVLYSEVPFSDNTLPTLLSSPVVNYVYVEHSVPSGQEIPLGSQRARYIRIQAEDTQEIALYEVIVPGGGGQFTEICNNGLDDDCDGKADCDDPDCSPVIWSVNKRNPTCPICDNGFIEIKAYGYNLQYSIDDGASFHGCQQVNQPGWCGFMGLGEGDYTIKVRNGSNGCITTWNNNPVKLRAPEGIPNNCCANGDFESGTFDNWTGGIGNVSSPPNPPDFPNNNQTINTEDNPQTPNLDDATHRILTSGSGYIDPEVNIPILSGVSGTYVVRLGTNRSGGKAERLTYCFTVEECNKEFLFNYLLVLEDPEDGHSEAEKPYFQFTITDNTTNEEVKKVKRVANTSDPFFEKYDVPNDEDDISYTYWNCELTDLSSRIGHEICVEFITSDCYPGEHFGYAYLDGLCNSVEDMKPTPILKNLHENYCKNQDVIIDGTESFNYNQVGWKICELNGNQEINCVEAPLTPDGDVGILNIKEFYESGSFSFSCGKTYRVKLTLGNTCVAPVSIIKDINYLCEDGVLVSYPDIINCAGDQADILINGQILNCTNCNIDWTPSQYLNNSNIANPTILGTLNVLAVKQTYSIVAMDQLGCIAEDDVLIYNLHSGSFTVSKEITFCDVTMSARFETEFPTPYGTITVNFVNTITQQVIPGEIIEEVDASNVWNFTSGTMQKTDITSGIWEARYEFNSPTQTNCISYAESLGQIDGSSLYFGNFYFCLPNLFTPNGDGINDTYRPAIPFTCGGGGDNPPPLPPGYSCADYGHNAYWGKITVYGSWGPPVYEKEVTGSFEIPFNMDELAWNGKSNEGNEMPTNVYTIILQFENCSIPRDIQCEDENVDCSTDVNCKNRSYWARGVALVR